MAINCNFLFRNNFILYRILPVLCIFILMSVWTEDQRQNFLKKSKQYHISSIMTYFIESSKPILSPEILEEREQAKLENRDEFLDSLLEEVDFSEIDLIGESTEPFDFADDPIILTKLHMTIQNLAENGSEATVPPERHAEADKIMKNEYLNRLLSDFVPLNRSLPDVREPECQNIVYNINSLPTTSVIIIFHNEPFSLLVRTIHSIFERTPPKLLKEVVLVDDFSDHPDLQGPLLRYLATRFPLEKTRLMRPSIRSGLVRARMIGAHVATGDVLIFLDAHCEATYYWSEPILARIKEKRTAVVSPVVDQVHTWNYEYQHGRVASVGAFSWSMYFHWIRIPEMEQKRREFYTEILNTPTIIGGLFGIERKYFWEIGSYDPGMIIWGGENLEMSFRIWQCGGSMEIHPCSRVGHIYRAQKPYTHPTDLPDDTHSLNTARLVEVWLDKYKELYYGQADVPRLEDFDKNENWTNVSLRKAFRKRKQCKSFKWYLDNVYPDKFAMQFDSKLYGQLRNKGYNSTCLDYNGHDEDEFFLETYPCHSEVTSSQTMHFSNKDELRFETVCASVWPNNRVRMIQCVDGKEDDRWKYRSGQLYSTLADKCITLREDLDKAESLITILEVCNVTDLYQQWDLSMKWK